MNHVPDDALAAIDRLGEGLLRGEPRPVRAGLRSDLALRIPCDGAALAAGETTVAFHLGTTAPEGCLRDHGPFVGTVVDGVEARLRDWGLEPPPTYDRHGEVDGRHRYAGPLGLV